LLFALPEFDAADFAADGFRQIVNEFDLTRILVWRGDALDVFLQFDCERLTTLRSQLEPHESLDD